MRGSVLHFLIKFRVVVVKGVFSDVMIFGLGFRSAHDQFVGVCPLTNCDAVQSVSILRVRAKVGNEIVDWVAERRFLVEVLVATGGRADGIRSGLRLNEKRNRILVRKLDVLDDPLVAETRLSISQMLSSVDHILVEVRREVVVGVLSDVMPLGLGLWSAHDQLVSVSGLADLDGAGGGDHVGIRTVVRHWIVNGVTQRSLLVLILGAACRRADRVRVKLDSPSRRSHERGSEHFIRN